MTTAITSILNGLICAGVAWAMGHDVWIAAGLFSASGHLCGALTFQS